MPIGGSGATTRSFVALTYARAASYWDAYYRRTLTLNEYPPHLAMFQVERLVER
jgi:methylmalonyl-CoA mutase N-terminal domain/subunit